MLNQKQNLLRMLDGEMPEYVPVSRMGPGPNPPLTVGGLANPSILGDFRGPKGGYDPWGVHYVADADRNIASIPEPGNFLLEDVTKWEEVMKVPEHWKDWDWEKAAEKDKAALNWNPEMSLYVSKGFDDFFQQFIGLMGFENGLMALVEEPEACHALFDWMCDQVIDITKNVLYYYKPEAYYMVDDSASKYAPFVSRQMFEEFFVPRYKRTLDLVRDAGLPVFYHNCGRSEDLMPAMVRLGVRVWDPAQKENNIAEIKNRFGRQLIIRGGFEFQCPLDPSRVTEEEAREAVRAAFKKLAPNGAWIFSGAANAVNPRDPVVKQINEWINDEAEKLSVEVYK